jgi:hypothetical protein
MKYKNKYPELFDHALGLCELDIQGIKDNKCDLQSKELRLVNEQIKVLNSGACWWCSWIYATLNYTHWYDEKGYYRYYNTCTCPWMPGCGSTGYVRNAYCTCGASYPSMTISSRTNRFGYQTMSGTCGDCGYHWEWHN